MGLAGQSLFYVPSGPNDPKVTWASSAEETAFFNYLAGTPELAKYSGQVVPRNSAFGKSEHTVNLHIEQQIPVYGSARVIIFGDCYNFANLLNHNWGITENYDGSFETKTVAGTGYIPTGNGGAGQYLYVFNAGTLGTPTIYSDLSRWLIQIGARLEF